MGKKTVASILVVLCLALFTDRMIVRAKNRSPERKGGGGCTSCHTFSPGLSHPVGVPVPGRSTLPLEGGRLLGCGTCHTDRTRAGDHGKPGRQGAAYHLRLPKDRLCRTCHQRGPLAASRRIHGLVANRAHYGRKLQEQARNRGIDRESRRCLGCHDGSLSAPAPFKDPALFAAGRNRGRSSHPVGVPYLATPPEAGGKTLRPTRFLPSQIRLPEGKVGCTSCHSLYSRKRNLLVVGVTGSWLCLTCHVK